MPCASVSWTSQRGVAAVEFAMIMPVLLILFLSTFDVGNAILIYLKVRSATYELAAITNQYGIGSTAEISTSTMTAITGATSAVMRLRRFDRGRHYFADQSDRRLIRPR